MPRVKIKAGRKFHATVGSGDDRHTAVHEGGAVIEVTDAQLRNFPDVFEDPNAAPQVAGETLTPDEQAALARFREEKRKEAEAEQAKVASNTDKASQQVVANTPDAKPAEDKPADKPKK
jgi:hypothetical protein